MSTFVDKIEKELVDLTLQGQLKIHALLLQYWGSSDPFIKRCFDVHFSKARGRLREKGMIFKRVKGVITRLQ